MPGKSSDRKKRLTRRDARDLDIKINFLEGIVRRDPEYVEALQVLGDNYTLRGRYDHSLQVDKQLSILEPDNPLAFYNLACSHSLKGQFEEAVEALEAALDLGYSDFRYLSRDPDFGPLRRSALYRRIRDKIRRLKARSS